MRVPWTALASCLHCLPRTVSVGIHVAGCDPYVAGLLTCLGGQVVMLAKELGMPKVASNSFGVSVEASAISNSVNDGSSF